MTIVTFISDRPYHHGDLRRALLDAAVARMADGGVAALSLRELARDVGVSHAAPTHHFGDKTGLLAALASEGFDLLAERLAATWQRTHDFREVGVAYVLFALDHPVHFSVMFDPESQRVHSKELSTARDKAYTMLAGPLRSLDATADRDIATAAWSIAHGLASLLLAGAVHSATRRRPETVARAVLGNLFRPSPGQRSS